MSENTTCRLSAYAKINTYLAVTGVRSDGYHTLLSHMQALTLSDTLTIDWQAGEGDGVTVVLTCDRLEVPTDESNLITRAARALFSLLEKEGEHHSGRLCVHLEKRIPMAAGLGGGSADAAATLVGLNDRLGKPLDTAALCRLGATLGADIPFCIQSVAGQANAATARGIGEILTRERGLWPTLHLVVACHGEGVSTPWAYRRLDECGHVDVEAEAAYGAFLSALADGDLARIAELSYNCFEGVVLSERPAARSLMQVMTQKGAAKVGMSGSGPSVFGIFESETVAQHCLETLTAQGVTAYLCRPLS
jgi:4-diphosphocytidyl-2-C-methyl-D-erythritol kinase